MTSQLRFLSFLLTLCLAASFARGQAQLGPVDAGEVEAELVAGVAAIRPGESFDIALRMKMDPHWHIYWLNPGDSGFAPSVTWNLPEGFEVGPLEFPVPERIPFDPFLSYGYEGEVFILARVTAPQELKEGTKVRLEAAASWLACEEACVPGDANLALELPVGSTAAVSEYALQIGAMRGSLPVEAVGGILEVTDSGEQLDVALQWEGFAGVELQDPYFFVEQQSVIDSAVPQTFSHEGDVVRFSIKKSAYIDDALPEFSGLLYSENGFDAAGGVMAVRFSERGTVASASGTGSGALGFAADIGFVPALFYAFLGGLILNLMPCVFPVLSIKILGFVQQSGEDQGKVLRHGFAFGGGVLVSFWVLAGSLIALRAAGEELGWGFQLQQPEFVAVMLVVMFLFGLSMAGVFEMGTSAIGLQGKVKSEGYGGSFFSGVLATAVATPCTGPFMGQALGYALTLSATQSLIVFTALAAGMAAPYILLSANPSLINKLPRPGPWMETFKQAMAFPMFATCVWLVWVMGAHVGNDGLRYVLGGLVAIAIAAWIYGRWATPVRKPKVRRIAIGIAVLVLAGGVWAMMPRSADATEDQLEWLPYTAELVDELRGAGKPVFVDFTADWCLTCKANEFRVFRSEEVRERVAAGDVVLVKADWTKRDAAITRELAKFGRSSVPLYLMYDGVSGAAPRVLPQVLSPGLFLETIDEIGASSRESAIE